MGPDRLYFDDSDVTFVVPTPPRRFLAPVGAFVGETKVSASVDVFDGISLGFTIGVMSVVKGTGLGLFFVLNKLKGSGSSDSKVISGFMSHCDATEAPTCLEAG